ncbi:MAG TPA: GNAT family protein [Candidatus Nanopelagicales bacterium]|nr:GNAT family protein [Candidatus Nanopelagicales bacterium]
MFIEADWSEAGCFGEPAVVRVQRVLHAARGWIAEQERMVSLGRELALLHAERAPPDKLEAWVRCFERILAHAPTADAPALAATLRGVGAKVSEDVALCLAAASDVRASAATLERARPLPRGWMLSELPVTAAPEAVQRVQELSVASGLAPLPGWYLRGAEGRALTLTLRDAAGQLLGAATVCAALGPGDAAGRASGGSAQLDLLEGGGAALPLGLGMPVALCLRQDARGRGFAPVLASAAMRAACERFALRCFYAVVGSRDEIALRVAARCGFSPHPSECVLLAEPA